MWAVGWVLVATALLAGGENSKPAAEKSSAEKHMLRYRFQPGETVRWQVEQKGETKTTINGSTLVAEWASLSVKLWKVKEVSADGTATLENYVEDVDMRQKLSGRMEIRYNSKTDKKPPLGFEGVAESIGVPLSRVKLDAKGKVLHREHLAGAKSESQVTIPLPEEPVAVGAPWTLTNDLDIPVKGKLVKKVKVLQTFTLLEVADGIAKIRVATTVITPVRDPLVEMEVVRHEANGAVQFDIAAGASSASDWTTTKMCLGSAGQPVAATTRLNSVRNCSMVWPRPLRLARRRPRPLGRQRPRPNLSRRPTHFHLPVRIKRRAPRRRRPPLRPRPRKRSPKLRRRLPRAPRFSPRKQSRPNGWKRVHRN